MALGLAGSTKGKSQPLGWWEGAFKMQMSIVEPREALLFDWDPFCLYSPVWAMMRRGLLVNGESLGGPPDREISRGAAVGFQMRADPSCRQCWLCWNLAEALMF